MIVDIKKIRQGDTFWASNSYHTAAEDAHQNLDEKYNPWIVYDTEGNSYFEEDFQGRETISGKRSGIAPNALLEDIRTALREYTLDLCTALGEASSAEEKSCIEHKMKDITDLIARVEAAHGGANFDCERQIALIWSDEDVIALLPDLNQKQAMEVLGAVQAHHDCGVGVSWETLSCEAASLFPIQDFMPDMDLLLSHYDMVSIVLEKKEDGDSGVRVRCEETNTVLFQTSDEAHQNHVGHHVVLALYGPEDSPACVSIECEDCNEVILNVEAGCVVQ